MNKYALYFLTVVIVSARYCAESIPVLSETSDIALAHSTQADEPGSRKKDEATVASNEERAFPIESIMSPIKITAKSKPRTLHAAIRMDVSQIKGDNEALANQLEELGINIDGVVKLAKMLSHRFHYSKNNLEWMVLGKVYFKKARSSPAPETVNAKTLFHQANIEILDEEALIKWTTGIWKRVHLEARKVVWKMFLLIRNQPNLHLVDAAKMAFGSEYLDNRKLPFSDRIIEIMSEHNDVDEGIYGPLLRLDKDKNWKDLPSDKLLKRASHEYAADELQKPPAKKRKVA